MSTKSLTILLSLLSVVSATVIQTNAQVMASIAVQGSTDIRNFQVIQILNSVTAYGFNAQSSGSANSGSASGSSSGSAIIISSNGGILSNAAVTYSAFSGSESFNTQSGTFSASASALSTTFAPLAVVQYLDNNNNGKYDIGEEYSVTTVSQRNYNVVVTKSGSSLGTSAELVSYDAGDFGFRYSVQNRPVSNQGVQVTQDATKLDMWIRPVSAAQSNGKVALLALYSVFQASANIGGSASSNGNISLSGNGNIKFSNGGSNVGLSWAGSAQSSDQNGNAGTTKVTTEVLTVSASASLTINGNTIFSAGFANAIPKLLVFNFDATNPSEIYWDPAMGPNSASSMIVSVMAVIVALAFAL